MSKLATQRLLPVVRVYITGLPFAVLVWTLTRQENQDGRQVPHPLFIPHGIREVEDVHSKVYAREQHYEMDTCLAAGGLFRWGKQPHLHASYEKEHEGALSAGCAGYGSPLGKPAMRILPSTCTPHEMDLTDNDTLLAQAPMWRLAASWQLVDSGETRTRPGTWKEDTPAPPPRMVGSSRAPVCMQVTTGRGPKSQCQS